MTGFHAEEVKKPPEIGVDLPTEDEWAEIKEMASDIATTLHRIAGDSNEPNTIKNAVNCLVRHGLMTEEL